MVSVNRFLSLLFITTSGFWPLLQAQQQSGQLEYFLEKTSLQKKIYSTRNSRNGQLHITNLDTNFRDIFSAIRIFQLQQFNLNKRAILQKHRQQGKLQPQITKTQKFPCYLNNTRSLSIPTTVHRLRPGDIDIIGAMGDSLTAGSGILAESVLQGFAEFRGVAFTGGGLGNWRTYLTLPNIFKVFNPKLYGYAVANSLGRERSARFNVGEGNAFTQDMPFQAHVLVKRLQNDPKVDMSRHWKLISLLIGSNDICSDMCHYDRVEDFLDDHRKNLYKTLNILKTHIPRLVVNVIPSPNIADTFPIMRNNPLHCYTSHHIACSCIISQKFNSSKLQDISQVVKRMQKIDAEVANLAEFQMDTFTVLYQPFTTNLSLVKPENNEIQLKYFASDCFHLSQLGQAAAANLLWNNMLQTEDHKERIMRDPFLKFECPTKESPYIITKQNQNKF